MKQQILTIARQYDRKYGFPEGFVEAVIQIESNFDPGAFRQESGGRYSMGLMQVLRGGAVDEWEQRYGKKPDDWYYDIENNIKVGAWYLGSKIPAYLKRYDQDHTIRNIIIAYNAGIGNLIKGVVPEITKRYLDKVQRLTGLELGASPQNSGFFFFFSALIVWKIYRWIT